VSIGNDAQTNAFILLHVYHKDNIQTKFHIFGRNEYMEIEKVNWALIILIIEHGPRCRECEVLV